MINEETLLEIIETLKTGEISEESITPIITSCKDKHDSFYAGLILAFYIFKEDLGDKINNHIKFETLN